jgi:hypothetical protein
MQQRRRGGDVSLPAPMMPGQMTPSATPAASRGRASDVASIGRAREIGGDMDQDGEAGGEMMALQRVNEALDKKGPLSREFAFECVLLRPPPPPLRAVEWRHRRSLTLARPRCACAARWDCARMQRGRAVLSVLVRRAARQLLLPARVSSSFTPTVASCAGAP